MIILATLSDVTIDMFLCTHGFVYLQILSSNRLIIVLLTFIPNNFLTKP